jgi:MFS transporter, OFA family, oxalate/formate antiporter
LVKHNRSLVIFGTIIIQLSLGSLLIYSAYKPFLQSYFPQWSGTDLALPSQIVFICYSIGLIVAGRLQDKHNPRVIITIAGLLFGSGYIIASFAKSITLFVIGYSLLGGIGMGSAYVCSLAVCLKWFPDKRGIINGFAVLGFGMGGLLYTPIAKYLMASFGVMNAFLFLGIIFLLSVVLGAQTQNNPPENYAPEGWIPPASNGKDNSLHNMTYREVLKTGKFKILWFAHFVGLGAGLMIIMNITNIWESFAFLNTHFSRNFIPYDAYMEIVNKGIIAVTFTSVLNTSGRIVWGNLSEKIGRELTLVLVFALYGCCILSFIFMNSYIFFLLGFGIIGFCYGGVPSLYPALLADNFGIKNLGTNYGLIYTSFFFAGYLGPYIAPKLLIVMEKVPYETIGKGNEMMINTYQAGSYVYSFEIAGILCLLTAALLFVKRDR